MSDDLIYEPVEFNTRLAIVDAVLASIDPKTPQISTISYD